MFTVYLQCTWFVLNQVSAQYHAHELTQTTQPALVNLLTLSQTRLASLIQALFCLNCAFFVVFVNKDKIIFDFKYLLVYILNFKVNNLKCKEFCMNLGSDVLWKCRLRVSPS